MLHFFNSRVWPKSGAVMALLLCYLIFCWPRIVISVGSTWVWKCWVTQSAFATGCPAVFQSMRAPSSHPGPTQHVLYFHFNHPAGCVLVFPCAFNLRFLLPGSVAASCLKSGHCMKEIAADKISLALSRDAAFSPHFRNDLFAEARLKIQSPSGNCFVRNCAVVHRSRHIPESQASDAVWLGHSLVCSFADNCRVLRYILGTVLGAGTK